MIPLTNLNRRHQVGLFIVLVATGLILLLEASAKQTAGIVLLGLAATWLLGSLRLRVLWLIFSLVAFVAGIGVAAMPVLDDWSSFQTRARYYDGAISDLRQAVGKSKSGFDASEVAGLPPGAIVKPLSGAQKQGQHAPSGVDYDALAKQAGAISSRATATQQEPQKPGPWQKYQKAAPVDPWQKYQIEPPPGFIPEQKPGVIEIPESTQLWERPDAKIPEGATVRFIAEGVPPLVTEIPFPPGMKDEEIVNSIGSQLLEPRPTFSLRDHL
jgi:hypothetical protein